MTDLSAPPLQPCVLRILNGPLQGCEFPLNEPRTLFIVAPVDVLGKSTCPVSVPPDAIFVPLDHGGCNFEVLLEEAVPGGVTVRLLDEPTETRHCLFQRREHIGDLQIVLRSHDQDWAPESLGMQRPPSLVATRRPWTRNTPAKWFGGGLALSVLVASVGVWSLPEPTPETDVRALITGVSAEVEVVNGRDQSIYVLVSSERDAGWSRQVLMRNNLLTGKVLVKDQERRRLEQLLVDHDPQLAWHSLDLKDPSVPRLLISAQRNVLTPSMQTRLVNALLEATPYARDVTVQVQNDTLLATLAQEGLQRLALGFSRVDHDHSVTFAVEGNLRDSELAAARHYIDGFYRQWGDRYVHFAIDLKDDSLKGKSFQTGPLGYIKMTSSSWHFPTQL
ncbi:type III secretion apparatus protein PrgH [Pseudomonas fluorescens HK44]|uniref:Type III secretion apparatus protein PrgH n=1 Tax=Pseudomonas fluorescens HK44 TaxID=1042209 RepID=A0A010S6M3_PSEFL|nr:PrgH/EprH family type III secretion apparatus protein [Pseudomonas fluorescens]EXF96159.1 type III secretion apparatus protein PrgH [Pseudomonas fluorescens HK44]